MAVVMRQYKGYMKTKSWASQEAAYKNTYFGCTNLDSLKVQVIGWLVENEEVRFSLEYGCQVQSPPLPS